MNNNCKNLDKLNEAFKFDIPEEAKKIAEKIASRTYELLDNDKILNELLIELYEVYNGEKREYQ